MSVFGNDPTDPMSIFVSLEVASDKLTVDAEGSKPWTTRNPH